MKKKKEMRGGSREGSGRPKKEETKTLSFRVLLAKSELIRKEILKIISDLNKI